MTESTKKSKSKYFLLCLLVAGIFFLPILLSRIQNRSLRIACVGDSITYGAKIKNISKNSYPARLQQLLGSSYLVKNFGASGYTLQKSGNYPYWDHVNFQKSSDFQPDIVLLMLGTNDSKTCNWENAQSFTKDYREMLSHYLSLESSPQVFLMTPATVFPESFNAADSYTINAEIVNLIAQLIRQLAQDENLPLIDIHSATKTHPEFFQEDGVHPNAQGASFIADCVSEAILTFRKNNTQ